MDMFYIQFLDKNIHKYSAIQDLIICYCKFDKIYLPFWKY